MAGFYCFTSPTPIVELTMRQKVVALTDAERAKILDGYTLSIIPAHLDHKLGIDKNIIEYVYNVIDSIQIKAKQLMRGEVVVTPAVLDSEGNVITPAVMNTPPITQLELATPLRQEFVEDLPMPFVTTIVQEMMKWSKYDGTGNFVFYKSQIIL